MKLINGIKALFRSFYLKRLRERLSNQDFSIIASNCNGALILHDLGLRFNSPFVNLWMKPKDFIKMLKDIQYYAKNGRYPPTQNGDIRSLFLTLLS